MRAGTPITFRPHAGPEAGHTIQGTYVRKTRDRSGDTIVEVDGREHRLGPRVARTITPA